MSEDEYVIEFVFALPKIGTGRYKDQYALVNNISKWYRWSKTQIKNSFKEELREWFIPPFRGTPYRRAKMEYIILRDTKRKMDSDSIALVTKWVQDTFVDQGYLVDDDEVTTVLHPAVLNQKNYNETMIGFKVAFG